MASLLDGQIKQLVYQGFKGRLQSGSLRRVTVTSRDSLGDVLASTVVSYPFEGIVDNYNAVYAAAAGIPQTDVRVLIIAGSLAVAPLMGDKLMLGGRWYEARGGPQIDPAGATYTLQCFEIQAP